MGYKLRAIEPDQDPNEPRKTDYVFIVEQEIDKILDSEGKILLDPSHYYVTTGEARLKTRQLIKDIEKLQINVGASLIQTKALAAHFDLFIGNHSLLEAWIHQGQIVVRPKYNKTKMAENALKNPKTLKNLARKRIKKQKAADDLNL